MEVKVKRKLATCPFCKKKIVEEVELNYNEKMKKWAFFHMCEGVHVCTTIVADTKEEVIERWNASQNRKEEQV